MQYYIRDVRSTSNFFRQGWKYGIQFSEMHRWQNCLFYTSKIEKVFKEPGRKSFVQEREYNPIDECWESFGPQYEKIDCNGDHDIRWVVGNVQWNYAHLPSYFNWIGFKNEADRTLALMILS